MFIQLTDKNGRLIVINVGQITMLSLLCPANEDKDYTRVGFIHGSVDVQETIETILQLITKGTL